MNDAGGPLIPLPGAACRFPGAPASNAAECPLAGRSALRLILAEASDDVGVGFLPAGVPVHFSGGAGDDQLRIAGGSVTPPDVTMDGGPGNDGMFIGQGLPAMPATATVLGGDGNDEVLLTAGTLATADLGAGNDRFTVTSSGRAVVDAGVGNDRGVFAPAAAAGSRLAGGPGDDTMATGRGLAGVSTCGLGRDRMQSVAEAVALDCELGDQAIALPGRDGIGPTTVTFSRSLTAGVRVGPVGLTGRLRVYFVADQSAVRRRVPRIASAEVRVRRGQTPTVRLRMSARERAGSARAAASRRRWSPSCATPATSGDGSAT